MPETPDEELVRRLLADARHDEPVPADVVARLDAVLADLGRDRSTGEVTVPSAAPVTSLGAERRARRRRWALVLAGAAAGVVLGLSVPHWHLTVGNDTAADSRAGSSSGKSMAEPPTEGRAVARLHRSTLRADVRRLAAALPSGGAELAPSAAGGELACAPADWGPGTVLPARLDGEPVVLVLRPPVAGRRVADVLACGSTRVVASVTVPAP